MSENNSFETWAVVEVMGHKRFAGYVSEQTIGGTAFVRVDVPAIEPTAIAGGGTADGGLPAFTKILGAASIYAITPCTEETARAFAAKQRERAFATYEAPRLMYVTDKPVEPYRDELDNFINHEEDDDSPV